MQDVLHWLANSWPTLLICAALAALLTLALISLIRERRKGGSCGCGCNGCALRNQCHETASASSTGTAPTDTDGLSHDPREKK